MDGAEGNAGQPGPAERSHRSSVSSVGARAADVLVYLADDTVVPLAVENLSSISAQELHRAVHEVLQLPDVALEAFALWLVSPLLEVQLKPKHQPYKLGRQWPELLLRFTDASDDDVAMDEPSLQFRRNVFFPKRRELQIHDEAVLRLFYEEAKGNVLTARYPCDLEDCEVLGALVCRVQLGPYQPGQPAASCLFSPPLPSPQPSPETKALGLWVCVMSFNSCCSVTSLQPLSPPQAELMSGLIEYCIELSQASEPTLPQESASGPQEAPSSSPPPTQRPKLRRQGSVVCSRIQHLSTIDYVEDGKGIKRVKPKRTTSFFSRQLSSSQGSYTVVQPTDDSLEQS
uniref:FERM domain-containing protein 8 n=1 Tax=Cricetulus griseus TaxID=10029 RepID=A0A8C2MLM2_CRIGR